ncbi:hypothetical protein SELMODRAFT_445822 [Selaginella moellendorffii]|uniref:Pyrrolo-quinoline quinone repeat domain-containing protein n=1 Tax=Selaginella moellendorffii TaxID=88036 RepID=D8SLM7_SELML|nr:uncharacterized protein LOC9645038 [Selaginella moellendorffii]EFJ14687.1 hypothetical protein SELMODRAFT_445822 [Selaginella moellendorffii]|eukprot:XP_002984177.1 uncharacterized protein LOC9645038 [Selaginella moellendorffii]
MWCLLQTKNWISHGGDLGNRRYAASEHKINLETAPSLALRWRYVTQGDVSATPAIHDCAVYVPSWNGIVAAVAMDGATLWQTNLSQVTSLHPAVSRATPVVTKRCVLVGLRGPARVLCLDRMTGDLLWMSQDLELAPHSMITMSGTAYDGAYYVGVSSMQQHAKSCCTFQGSFHKLDLQTGQTVWSTYMVPRDSQYTGVPVWGSSPALDERRGLVYISTGSVFSVPSEVRQCQQATGNSSSCIVPSVCYNSVVAVDTRDGTIRWCSRMTMSEIWENACRSIRPPPNCPPRPDPDADFGESPMLVTIQQQGALRDVVVTGQKTGFVWAHDRETGELVWHAVAGPGGSGGGANWGSATDNSRVFTNIANSDRQSFLHEPSQLVTTGGGWVAMAATTGRLLWSTPNPTGQPAYGPVTYTHGGVLLCTSFDSNGHVYAINSYSGEIIWNATTGSTVYGGFSVGCGCAFVGAGYASTPTGLALGGTPGDSLFAFCVPPY